MTTPPPARRPVIRARYEIVIRHPDRDDVLVDHDGRLPAFDLDESSAWQEVGPVVRWSRDALDLEIAVLRPLRPDDADPPAIAPRRYEAEWLRGEVPAGWGTRAVGGLPDAVVAALAVPVGVHQPWYLPGWFASMSAWVDARLAEAGIRPRGPLRQVRSWGRSALLDVETDRGRIWAKDVPEVFAHEIRVTDLLADLDPGLVPSLIAADLEVGRMLVAHVEGTALTTLGDQPLAWTATLGRIAEAQRVLARDPAVLSMAGVPAARLDDLAAAIPAMLADDGLLGIGRSGGLTEPEARDLRSRTGEFVAAARRLDADGVRPSLDHGDFAADQVIVGEMGPVILDWSDATITHPFLTAASFLGDPAARPPGIEDDLAAAYLGPWGDGLDGASLGPSLADARLAHPFHMARLYAERILPGLDQPWEMASMAADHLRRLVGTGGPAT